MEIPCPIPKDFELLLTEAVDAASVGERGDIMDGRKIWKLSPMDLESYRRWYDYSRARDEMFATVALGG